MIFKQLAVLKYLKFIVSDPFVKQVLPSIDI